MADSIEVQVQQLREAIAALQGQRAVLGDATVDAALVPLKQQIEALNSRSELRVVSPSRSSPHHEERRIITILFSDVVGSVTLAEKLDPEEWKGTIAAVQSTIGEIVTRHQGMIAQYQGDALIAFFGAREANECDAENAVLAGLAAQDAIAKLELATPVRIRVGINTGLVVLGEWGADAKIEFGAFGDPVNVAARLQTSAAPGTVLISDATYRQVRGVFKVETLPPLQLKGKSEPLLVHRVLGLQSRRARASGLEPQGISSPIVGRDAEFSKLEDCIRRLLQGQGGILSIIGEAGVGKSRLITELRKSRTVTEGIRQSALHWLEGSALSFGQSISYWPFREILQDYASITEEDNEAERWRKLEGAITVLFRAETPEILPYLSVLLALEVRDEYAERVKYLDGEAMRHQLFLVARRFFERLAQVRPVVLVFEDLHWADESSVLLLEHLLPLIDRAPLLICWLSRPDPSTPAARLRELAARTHAACFTEFQLAPLGRSDSALLVHNLLAIEDLAPRVHDLIIQKAEGNPFFLEEIVRSLIDSRVVVRDRATGRWRATEQIETLTLPDTVQGVIMARIDRLEEDVRQVLKTAAVIGRSFLYRLLGAIAEADRELDEHLAELQAVEFISEKQRLPELEFIFRHALAQEAAYESILRHKRRELHTQVARAIEALFRERLEEFYSLLAYHYARAEEWDKAQEYLFKAGDQAGRVAADAEALAHYEQALAAYARVFGERWDPVQRAALERKMGEAFYRRGEQRTSLEYFGRALRCLDYDFPAEPRAVHLAILKELSIQVAHRLWPHHFVVTLRQRPSPLEDEVVLVFRTLAWIAFLSNADLYVLWSLRSLNFAERTGRGTEVAATSASCGIVSYLAGLARVSEWYLKRAVALGESLASPFALGNAYSALAGVESWQGRLEAAHEHCLQGVKSYRQAGDLYGLGLTNTLLSLLLYYQGDLKAALQVSLEVARVGEEAGHLSLVCWGEFGEGATLVRLGRVEEAMTHLNKAIEMSERVPDHTFFVGATAELGRCYALQGELARAFSLLETSQQRRKQQNVNLPSPITHLLNARAFACVLDAEQQGPGGIRGDLIKRAADACQAALKHSEIDRTAGPEAIRLQGTLEWLRGRPDAARTWWERSMALADAMGTRYDLGMVYLEMGRRLGKQEILQKAVATLAEVGAERDWTQARDELARMG